MSRFVVTYRKWLLTTSDLYNKFYCKVLGCLPFTQTTRVEILCINIKLKYLTWWESNPLQSTSKSAEQTKMRRKIDRFKLQPIFSKASQTEQSKPLDFPTSISSFFHVNGRHPAWSGRTYFGA